MAGLKTFLPRTLYGRSLVIIVAPILLLQMIAAYVFVDRHWDSMSEKLAFAMAGEISMITDEIAHAKTKPEVDKIVHRAATSLDLLVTVEEGKKDETHAHRDHRTFLSVERKFKKALANRVSYPFTVTAYPREKWFQVSVKIDSKRTVNYLCYNRRLTSPTTHIFILWLVGSAVLLMGIAVLFMRNQIRPILRLAVAAEKLGKGQDVPKFKIEGAREVRQAARAFLDMRDRIRRQIEQRTVMLAGVSHDLRTPLTRMKLQLEMKQPDISHLREDLTEMEKMLEGYLAFAKGEGNENSEMVDLRSMLARIVANARRQGFVVGESLAPTLLIKARPVALERALSNIISNASKYAKHVWVEAREEDDAIEIFVDDDGPGIPAAQREEVFRPFYRLEKSRNQKTGGVGLGLSIAQDIVHGHGGEIFLSDSNRGGLRVTVRLPL